MKLCCDIYSVSQSETVTIRVRHRTMVGMCLAILVTGITAVGIGGLQFVVGSVLVTVFYVAGKVRESSR